MCTAERTQCHMWDNAMAPLLWPERRSGAQRRLLATRQTYNGVTAPAAEPLMRMCSPPNDATDASQEHS